MIRPLRPADAPAVADLLEQVMRSGRSSAPPGLADLLRELFLESPLADPEIPSLVYEDGRGEVAGFVGAATRRGELDGRPVRIATCSTLMTYPRVRGRGAGALLLKRFLDGPQDVTVSDHPNRVAERLFRRLGGRVSDLQRIGWRLPAAPADAHGGEHEELLPSAFGSGARGTDDAHQVLRSYRLRPVYDEGYFRWLLDHFGKIESRGRLEAVRVRDDRGATAGWFVTYVKPGGSSRVMQVAALEDHASTVLHEMRRHARTRGATCVEGRLEPRLAPALAANESRARLALDGMPLVYHSPDPAITAAIAAGDALLSLLEGEGWVAVMGQAFPFEPPGDAR